jgi:hypothetical protein
MMAISSAFCAIETKEKNREMDNKRTFFIVIGDFVNST